MNEETSKPASRLRPHPLAFEARAIPHLLEDVERKVRVMCRAMQFYCLEGADTNNPESDLSNTLDLFEVFYEFVDQKMADITKLREALEGPELSWVSLDTLRQSEDFERTPLPPEAFISVEKYAEYCERVGIEPGQRRYDKKVATTGKESK